jgi:hypothetical protein
MMDKSIQFPALVISKASIDRLGYKYLVGDKRLLKTGFKDVLIVDSAGSCFDVERVVQTGGLSLYYSITLVGYMVRIGPVLKQPVYDVNVEQLREMLIGIIKDHPTMFRKLLPSKMLIEEVKKAQSVRQLIDLFGY